MESIQEEKNKQEQEPQTKYQFDAPQILNLFKDALSGDNAKIKEATKYLKFFSKQEESLAPLLSIMATSPEVSMRNFSAILLKKNIIVIFDNLPSDLQREEVKKILLDSYFHETAKPVRESIAIVISYLVNANYMKDKGWPELFLLVDQKTNTNSPLLEREKGMALMSYLVELTTGELYQKYEKYLQFFITNIQDSERSIRVQTLKTVFSLFDNLDSAQLKVVEIFKKILPNILIVIDECIKHSEDEIVHLCLEVFSAVAEAKTKFLDGELLKLVKFIFSDSVIFNKSLSQPLKESALDFIQALAYHHRTILTEDKKILNLILVTLVNLASQPIVKDPLDETTETLQDICLWLIETLALRLPKKYICSTLLDEIAKLIHSNNENYMNSGFLILAAISEGCAHTLKNDIEKLLNNFIVLGISQVSSKVRGAAITALGYLSEFLAPEIVDYHKIIIPILLNSFNEADIKVAEKAVFSMDIFCENMEREIEPYLSSIMPEIANMTINARATNFMKKMAIMSIGSCVTSAQEAFRPFLVDCIKFLTQVIHEKNEQEFLTVKSAAIQSLGKIFMVFYSLESDLYTTVIQPCMEHIYLTMVNIDDCEIREASLSFFYLLASTMGQDFSPILDKIAEFAFKIAESEKSVAYPPDDDEFSLDTDSEWDSTDHKSGNELKVHMNFLDEKAAAIKAIGEFAQACPSQFFKLYFQRTYELVQNNISYFHENIRIQTAICIKNVGEGMMKSYNNGKLPKFKPGEPDNLPQELDQYLNWFCYNKLTDMMLEDESIEVRANALECQTQLATSLGPNYCQKHFMETNKYIIKRLRRQNEGFKKSNQNCRAVIHEDKSVNLEVDSGDGSEDDEDNDDRIMMFEYVTDWIPALSKGMGVAFKPIFISKMYNRLILLTQKSSDIDEKIQVMGTLAQTFKHNPTLIEIYHDKFIRLFEEMLQEKDDGLSRNVAFCCGICCLKDSKVMVQYFPRILKVLSKIYEEVNLLEAKENALAALARMIMGSPQNVPVEECLQKILSQTPFKGDLEEEKTIIKMLIFLCGTNEPLIGKYLEPSMMLILDAIINAIKYKMSDKTLESSVKIIKAICINNNDIKEKVQNKVLNLNGKVKERVIDLLK